ncbi:MAG: hypothetical protein V4567_01320 [Pseudomonadota bacterium]
MLLVPVSFVLLSGYSAHQVIQLARELVSAWLGAATTVLGFLIAAYAIVISVLKPEMLLQMARLKKFHTKDISFLKYNLLAFIGTLIDYFVFILICWGTILSVGLDVVLSRLVVFYPYPGQMRFVLAVSLFEIVAGGAFILIWDLKLYIFNLYRLTLDSVRWELRQRQKSDDGSGEQ